MSIWLASWAQAVADVRAFAQRSQDQTVRATITVGAGGTSLRLQLSNRFGAAPLVIGAVAVGSDDSFVEVLFNGASHVTVPPGGMCVSDRTTLLLVAGQRLVISLYLPQDTQHATANFADSDLRLSEHGQFVSVGDADFPAIATPMIPTPDGGEMVAPLPFLRGVDVFGEPDQAVIVCIGDSITASGWPALAVASLPAQARVVMLNRGIAGNRLRVDADPSTASFGLAGLARFDDDVLATTAVTDVVIGLGTNDLGLPGTSAPADELPTAEQVIGAYQLLIDRATVAGISPIIATMTPFLGAEGYDHAREDIRIEVNGWIRASAPEWVDFARAVQSQADPSRLAGVYDSGDHLHPNSVGDQQLAQAMVAFLSRRDGTGDVSR